MRKYHAFLLKCEISAIGLVEIACIFLIFVIATVQISVGIENARNLVKIYKMFQFIRT